MHLYAIDVNGSVIAADDAEKQKTYHCIECGAEVRQRRGIYRRTHFYHIAHGDIPCLLDAKSILHIQIQQHLKSLFPMGECILEHRFPSIGRIADIMLATRKIVIEIQCSPISYHEISSRSADYNSMGYDIVWILHDKTFNKRRLSAAELFLYGGKHPYYYTSISSDGEGGIYDQFDLISRGIRITSSHRHTIDITAIRIIADMKPYRLPENISRRCILWPFHFSGDILHRVTIDGVSYVNGLIAAEERVRMTTRTSLLSQVITMICRPFRAFFNMLLASVCSR